ncbi:putative pentatricopeptide repeat-containing protein At3g47840 isoform X2 [Selaginella moellendorffii]|uniref:putative pentatricopeptide repeat-containing protein At3g47840 isoform X2 n=1 Tax=Selaginella moellendorffii TaxID=88036 RepID=UPI000D1C8D79|nr:putative pentatricopeptide repeat-containing protein At3g47840 isoform X2 [Selaginella moellendorffii]|eukprot:XP_024545879.1 putative pentatricopeptide repeat-containing protein At3g47840 isoform X2 [Selaginella moellendorffii]
MYSRCGSMVDARRVFDGVSQHTVVLWNGLISGYAENDEDDRTFVAAVKACTSLSSSEQGREVGGSFVKVASLEKGMAVHSRAQVCNADSTTFVRNSVIGFYFKAGCSLDAERVFYRLQNPDAVSWNNMILGYAQNGDVEAALNLFSQMQATKCKADARTYVAVLKACITLATDEESTEINGKLTKKTSLEIGFAVHSQAAKRDFDSDNFVGNSLCAMYANCGSLVDAVMAFDRISRRCVVSWTTLMVGYAENGEEGLALEVLEWILSEKCCTPDSRTYAAALKACSNLAMNELNDRALAVKVRTLETGMAIHSQAAKSNFARDLYVESSLVDMYAKCGSLVDARMVFERMPCRDEVLTTMMIHAYAENGQEEVAIQLFQETRARTRYGCINAWTFSAVLKACSCVAALEFGRAVHAELLQFGLEGDAVLVNSLVDFYAGYSRQGDTSCVIDLFQQMLQDQDMKPGGITLLSVLTSCSHAGLFEKGKSYFREMQETHRISPDVEHYHAMIDMFGRANQLEDALLMVEAMPFKAEVITWTTLLAACVKWKNVGVGKKAFQSLLKIDEKNCASYVLMANNLLSGKIRKSSARVESHSQQNCSSLVIILGSCALVKNGFRACAYPRYKNVLRELLAMRVGATHSNGIQQHGMSDVRPASLAQHLNQKLASRRIRSQSPVQHLNVVFDGLVHQGRFAAASHQCRVHHRARWASLSQYLLEKLGRCSHLSILKQSFQQHRVCGHVRRNSFRNHAPDDLLRVLQTPGLAVRVNERGVSDDTGIASLSQHLLKHPTDFAGSSLLAEPVHERGVRERIGPQVPSFHLLHELKRMLQPIGLAQPADESVEGDNVWLCVVIPGAQHFEELQCLAEVPGLAKAIDERGVSHGVWNASHRDQSFQHLVRFSHSPGLAEAMDDHVPGDYVRFGRFLFHHVEQELISLVHSLCLAEAAGDAGDGDHVRGAARALLEKLASLVQSIHLAVALDDRGVSGGLRDERKVLLHLVEELQRFIQELELAKAIDEDVERDDAGRALDPAEDRHGLIHRARLAETGEKEIDVSQVWNAMPF